MGKIKKTANVVADSVGSLTGGAIKLLGKAVKSDYVQEIGDGVKNATSNTGEVLGGLAEGTFYTAKGLIDKDEKKKEEGLNELKDTGIKTAKGVGNSIKNTYYNGKDVVQGVVHNDKEQIIKGVKGIGKTAAVATLAIGALDVLDIVDIDGGETHVEASTIDHTDMPNNDGNIHYIETRNDDLAGQYHPETGVEFESKIVTLPSGDVIEGVFPVFDSEYTATIPQSMYLESDEVQFNVANDQLANAIKHDPSLRVEFTKEQIAQIYAGETPDGYTWHHSEEPGKLELVDEEIHANTGHTGGRELWGGGSDYR